MYQRERASRMYRISSYYIAKQISELPQQFAIPFIIVVSVYWIGGLKSDFGDFVVFSVIVISMVFSVNSFGMTVGAIVPAGIAAIFVPSLLLILFLVAGFYINPSNFPDWIGWLKYFSPFYYSFLAIVYNQFNDFPFYCKSDQFVHFETNVRCSNGDMITVSSDTCLITNGDAIVEQFDADNIPVWGYIIILLGFVLIFRILAYLGLRNCNPKEVELN